MTPLGSLLDATAFLTRVPVPARENFDLARAAWAFPVVGAVVGASVGGVAVGAAQVLPPLVAAVLAVVAEVLLTGALHLDGLADCADGCGGRDRKARLRIMKDSSTGVYGVTAVALDLLLKVALLHGLLEVLAGQGWALVALCAAVWAASRTTMLPLAGGLPYARAEGTGRSLVEGLTTGRIVTGLGIGLVLAAALVAAAVLSGAGVDLRPEDHVPPGSATSISTLVGSLLVGAGLAGSTAWSWARRALGGVTGDVLGTTAELVTLASLVAVTIVLA